MRVLLVGKAAPEQGGIPALLEQLLASDLASTHDLALLNLTRDSVVPGGAKSWVNVRRTLEDMVRVARASRGQDVVHLHTAFAPMTTVVRAGLLVWAGSRGGAVVVHVHGGLVEHWLHGRWRCALTRLGLRPARHVVAVSEGARRALASVLPAGSVQLIDNGVDERQFAPADDPPAQRRPRVLYVGILSPRKGVLDLFIASSALLARGVDHELVLAGGNQEEGPAVESAVRAEAPDHARLLGPVPRDQMAELLRSADVFCLPSWLEAMPMSVLEAMSTGLPVVCTAVGELDRVVDPHVTGLLVPPRDPEALADALAVLLKDPVGRRRMGAAGRERLLERFTISATARRVRSLYEVHATNDRAEKPTSRSRAMPGT